MLDPAEFRFAELGKIFRGSESSAASDDAFIEIHVLPADLAAQQARGGGLAAAHEADEADERARANFSWSSADFVSRIMPVECDSASAEINHVSEC